MAVFIVGVPPRIEIDHLIYPHRRSARVADALTSVGGVSSSEKTVAATLAQPVQSGESLVPAMRCACGPWFFSVRFELTVSVRPAHIAGSDHRALTGAG